LILREVDASPLERNPPHLKDVAAISDLQGCPRILFDDKDGNPAFA
jgi:hypothetical protein